MSLLMKSELASPAPPLISKIIHHFVFSPSSFAFLKPGWLLLLLRVWKGEGEGKRGEGKGKNRGAHRQRALFHPLCRTT